MRRGILVKAIMIGILAAAAVPAFAQARETYTGTVLSYGYGFNTRTRTNTFTLNIKGRTSGEEADRQIAILQEGGQDDLLKAIRNNDLGSFSIGGRLGRTLHSVQVDDVNGKKRIRAFFERWLNFREIRGGYRSLDYPFGYIELVVDPRTGKGEGTLIEAAQVRWKHNKKLNDYVVEVEDFGTYPSRLMGVIQRNRG